MPNYEYQCKKCGHVFERDHAIGETKKYRCPDCSSQSTKKIISAVGVIFKGTGFYSTDIREAKGRVKTSGNGEKPDKKSDTKTETPSPASEN